MSAPVRILQVVTTMNLGGLENFLMNLYRNIDRSKIQFDFLVHRDAPGTFDDEIRSLGGRIYNVGPINPKTLLSYRIKLRKFFEQHSEFSIVHSHLNTLSVFVLFEAKKRGISGRIAHSHASTASRKYGFYRSVLIGLVTKYSSHNIACSADAGKWLFGDDTFTIIKNSIDCEKFAFNVETRQSLRKNLQISDDTVVFGNVASFSPVKNHSFLLEIFSIYHKTNPNSYLILMGDGILRDEIKLKINELDISENIILLGAIQNTYDYLNVIDMYIFPSLSEGFGLALLEAQCNGIPIIMSDTMPEDINITDLGRRVSLNDHPEKWSEEIFRILDLPSVPRISYKDVVIAAGFDVENNVQILSGFYEEFLLNVRLL
ncbi:glycosyltransferase family 1 protein [Kaistella palustris]|uniref:glycosyltransferase family 1 protein n=1 Tax=Kaistella palustris TaxID=493376 RepID=UPI000425138D|nr:glycosyltransferase family 1 protein [Kaistella palustris]